MREWITDNPESHRARCRKSSAKARAKKHGYAPIKDFDRAQAVFIQQGLCCAICRRTSEQGKLWAWHVDHDHVTGELRGVLCIRCNTGLGGLQDSERILQRAIRYLQNPPARRRD